MRVYKPGETVQRSGQYRILDANGKPTMYEVTCVLGEPFPPLKYSGYRFRLIDPTNHR